MQNGLLLLMVEISTLVILGVPTVVGVEEFQVGRYKFQVGVGGKTWKCVIIRVETDTKPIEIRHVLGWKS